MAWAHKSQLLTIRKDLSFYNCHFKCYLVIMLLNIYLLLKRHFLADMGLVKWFF